MNQYKRIERPKIDLYVYAQLIWKDSPKSLEIEMIVFQQLTPRQLEIWIHIHKHTDTRKERTHSYIIMIISLKYIVALSEKCETRNF